MRIRLTRAKFTGLAASLAVCTLLLAFASGSYAGPLYDRGTLYRPPQTIKPPGPRVRDRGGEAKFVARRCGLSIGTEQLTRIGVEELTTP